jgi:hypothetical protein
MNQRQRVLAMVIAVLGLVAMACTCSLPKVGGPVPPATVPVSKQAADQMQKKIDQAQGQMKSTGQFKITVTESELSSYLVQELEKQKTQGDAIPLSNPQIKLTKGQLWVYGTFASGSAKINGLAVVSAQVQNDRLQVKITRLDLGAFPVPKALLDQMNEQIQTSLDEQTSSIVLTGIVIREGEMDVTGKRN